VPQVINDGSLAYVYGLGRISQVADDDTTFYYLSDGLGSTMALTDADGEVANTYEYDVFGAVRASTGSQPNEFRFTGEQADDSTSLQYLRARYYDPAVGRFLSRDPLPFIQRYAYVGNNPVRFTDPYGLGCPRGLGWACDVAGGIKAGAEWLGEDYHWLTVAEVGGGAACVAGLEIVTAGTATPLVAGLGGALIAGGLGVGVSATAVDIALRTKGCREGSQMSCAEAGVTAVTAPFSFVPGERNLIVGLIGPTVNTAGDIWTSLHQEEPLACMRPPKE
jgi:RHS repeat-associated protein